MVHAPRGGRRGGLAGSSCPPPSSLSRGLGRVSHVISSSVGEGVVERFTDWTESLHLMATFFFQAVVQKTHDGSLNQSPDLQSRLRLPKIRGLSLSSLDPLFSVVPYR